jgi:putative membrane protein
MRMVLRLLAMMIVIAISPQVISGIHVDGLGSALIAAVLYSLLVFAIGWFVRFVVALLSIVPGILTLGLFFLLIPILASTVLLKLTAGAMTSFTIDSWFAAFLLSAALHVLDLLLERPKRP